MKNFRRLLPALCLLLISAMCAGTSTYAWFSMNNQVSASGMEVKAKADSGIVIKEAGSANAFATTVTVTAEAAELYPTSTLDFTTWKKGSSSSTSSATANVSYTDVASGDFDDYYKKFSFTIRSSASGTDVENVKLAVSELIVSGSSNSAALDKCLRVAVVYGTQKIYFAPLAANNVVYTPGYGTTEITAYNAGSETLTFDLAGDEVPASDTGINVDVYMYYEGEDPACISDNITASLDTLSLTIAFKTVDK